MNYNRKQEGIEIEHDNGAKQISTSVESYLLYEIFVSLQEILKIQIAMAQATKGGKKLQ